MVPGKGLEPAQQERRGILNLVSTGFHHPPGKIEARSGVESDQTDLQSAT